MELAQELNHHIYKKSYLQKYLQNWRSIKIIEEIDELGRGSYGIVVKARTSENEIVAIKELINGIDSDDDLKREGEIMKKLKHPNVVCLLAILRNTPRLVLEFVAGGDLFSWLQLQATCNEEKLVDRTRLQKMAKYIAVGMEYLSSQRIIHRDLAARNCLVNIDLNIKISDFGLAVVLPNGMNEMTECMSIPIRWMPPEAIGQYKFSLSTDVYSYGIVVWELFTLASARPYPVTIFFILNFFLFLIYYVVIYVIYSFSRTYDKIN